MSEENFSSHYVENLSFDREIPLNELIQATEKQTLLSILNNILKAKFKICDEHNTLIIGDESCKHSFSKPLVLELEQIGVLITECSDPELLNTATQFILMQIRFAQKFLMASALHIEAIQEDYATLCKEHEQLLVSEANYKNLCDHLDEKVQEQVHTIENTQRKLFESEKMASIGHLAAGVAHEINNPIGFINSNLNTAKNYVKDFESIKIAIYQKNDATTLLKFSEDLDLEFIINDFMELLDDCIDGGKRVAAIVADLKLFSNIDAAEEVTVDIRQYIKSTCNIAKSSIDKPITIHFETGDLPSIKCRPGYIGQVILALILNSAHAVQENGKIQVSTAYQDNRVYIYIEDNGPGIPADVIKKVFDPFFTTKDVGDGKGLGLTTCRDIITAHGGEIIIESDGSTGTKVTFWLPTT